MLKPDTHLLLRSIAGDDRLRPAASAVIEAAIWNLCFSAMAVRETAMPVGKGKSVPEASVERLVGGISASGVTQVAVTARIDMGAATLAGSLHGDPADRPTTATAPPIDGRLLTADYRILAHAAAGQVRAIDARR